VPIDGCQEFVQNVGSENFLDFAHGAVGVEFVAVGGDAFRRIPGRDAEEREAR